MLALFYPPAPASAPVVVEAPLGPARTFAAALYDVTHRVPAARRRTTRYLSLEAVPEAERPRFMGYLTRTLNSLSWLTPIEEPVAVPGGLLVRVDLTALLWDCESRGKRIAGLNKLGVKFANQNELIDIWELFAKDDPYYVVTQNRYDVYHRVYSERGWVDPGVEAALRNLTYSCQAVLRADWLLAKLWVEKDFGGGYYSQTLLLPATEAELYKVLAVDDKRVDLEIQLRRGAAVLDSDAVARFNRELQLIPGAFGEVPFVWRTFDFKDENSDAKDVMKTFAGRVKHDGREIIFSLPNGLHGFYLSDGKGKQAAVVPQDIALDRRPDPGIRERNVANGYKCVECHSPHLGIWPFDDAVSRNALRKGVGLVDRTYGKGHGDAGKRQEVEEYYLSGLDRQVKNQQESYAAKVARCYGADPKSGPETTAVVTLDALTVVRYVDAYTWDLVDLNQAAREVGLDPEDARALFRKSYTSEGALLAAGESVRRGSWERAFPKVMRSYQPYPWDYGVGAKAKPGAR